MAYSLFNGQISSCSDIKWPHDGTVSAALYFLFIYFLTSCLFFLDSYTGSGQKKKTVFVDSPLLKSELTVRERSHIFHEESLKLSLRRTGSRGVFHILTELPASEQNLPVCRCLSSPHTQICRLLSLEQSFFLVLPGD